MAKRKKKIFSASFRLVLKKTKGFIDLKYKRVSQLCDKYLKLEEDQVGLKPIKYGIYAIGIFFLIFFVWAGIMPINSSSIAQGTVVLDFNKKIIQHLEGGLIQDIMVKEGQEVVTGYDLVILQNIQAKSQQSAVQKQLLNSRAIYKRLIKDGLIEVRPFSDNKWSKYSWKKSTYMLTPKQPMKTPDDEKLLIVEEEKNDLEKDPRKLDLGGKDNKKEEEPKEE